MDLIAVGVSLQGFLTLMFGWYTELLYCNQATRRRNLKVHPYRSMRHTRSRNTRRVPTPEYDKTCRVQYSGTPPPVAILSQNRIMLDKKRTAYILWRLAREAQFSARCRDILKILATVHVGLAVRCVRGGRHCTPHQKRAAPGTSVSVTIIIGLTIRQMCSMSFNGGSSTKHVPRTSIVHARPLSEIVAS